MQFMKRSGPDMCGINGNRSARRFARTKNTKFDLRLRAQSNAEHTFLVFNLSTLLFDNYLVYDYDHNKFFIVSRSILQHEVGENKIGDIPDDGTRPKNIDQIELGYLRRRYWKYLPPNMKDSFEYFHHNMEEGLDDLGVFCKMCDKFAYILDCLCWEALGRVGDMRIKRRFFKLSDADKVAIKYTKTNVATDIFLYNTLEGHKEFFTHEYFKYFIELVQSAAFIARGSEIAWLHEYLSGQ